MRQWFRRMRVRWRAWRTVFGVFVQSNLTYRSTAVVWMMTDTVPAILMPLVWLASYNGRADIGGYRPADIVAYYIATLGLANLMVTHIMWDISTEIREGTFSIYLTRPFSYVGFQYAGNLSWRLMRVTLFIPVLALVLFIFRGELVIGTYSLGPVFWLAIAGGHLLSFGIGFSMGMLAFFFVEVRSIYMFYYMPMTFLGGQVVPLPLLPEWVRHLAEMAPFRYTLAFPAEILLQRVTGADVERGFCVLGAWLVAAYGLAFLLWRSGLRRYTGVGM